MFLCIETESSSFTGERIAGLNLKEVILIIRLGLQLFRQIKKGGAIMSKDVGEEFELTDEQFREIVTGVLETVQKLMLQFFSSPKESYKKIGLEYKEIYDNYYKIYKGYKRRMKLGIDVIPTVRFDNEAGVMSPGYRHRDSVDRFNKWHKVFKKENHKEMVS